MKEQRFKLSNKASVSLMSLIGRKSKHFAPTAAATMSGFQPTSREVVSDDDRVSVLIDSSQSERTGNMLADGGANPEQLSKRIISANIDVSAAERLVENRSVRRIQTKKKNQLFLDNAMSDIGLLDANGNNQTGLDGTGTLIGVVDSGFDLSHPMFKDSNGNLRVEGLLDQTTNQSFTTSQLATGWQNGQNPGEDTNGHGTHVASIAGGSRFGGLQGVAPGARFFLVKTDFLNVDNGVSWIFNQAGARPCVVNLSLGNHFGAHDGTDLSERLYDALTGPGKLIVAAAGNEQNDAIHIGGRFATSQTRQVGFDVSRQQDGPPFAVITLWYDRTDRFDVDLFTPTGQQLSIPALGNSVVFQSSFLDIELSKKRYTPSGLKQIQITIEFKSGSVPDSWLDGWMLQMQCKQATIGRLDGWFNNSGFARFHPGTMVEETRTIGLPATGKSVLSVASHVSKNTWSSDDGPQQDLRVVNGRNSPFSSHGPTRDNREKPEISAPGQYLTAALAGNSSLANFGPRADNNNRLLTIEGTSMAAPVVAGAVSLMLQNSPNLTPAQVRTALAKSAIKDMHTGLTQWTPAYGHGKLDIVSAIGQL